MEIFRALAVLVEPPTVEAARVAEALGLGAPPGESEYTETFVFQLYPYASVYLGAEGMVGGEARDRVAGFWRALGQTPPAEADHLSLMLALYARLCELEAGPGGGGWHGARRAFLWEHLLSWLPAYLDKLEDIAPPFYRSWGGLLSRALLAEAEAVGRQEALPLQLREAPALVDPREGGAEEFLRSLVAPVRAGVILTRADLNRAARQLGTGTRVGERLFILKTLLGQDAAGTLGWLADEASVWAERHGRRVETFGAAAEFWKRRAEDAATLLRELQRSVGDEQG